MLLFDVIALSVDRDTAFADLIDVEVELCKSWLLLEEKRGPLSSFDCFQLFFFVSDVFLVLELNLVIALELFFSVSSLEVDLDFD